MGISRSLLHGHSQPPLGWGLLEKGSQSQRPREHSASFILFHFSQAMTILSFLSCGFHFTCRKGEIMYPDYLLPPKTAFHLSTTKTKSKANLSPHTVLLFYHFTGQGTLPQFLFPTIREEAQAKTSKGTSWFVSRCPRAGFYFSIRTNSIY